MEKAPITTVTGSDAPIAVSAWRFFVLVLLLSIPFYLLGLTRSRLPGLPILPVSALMTFVPMIAALILIYRQHDRGAALTWLSGMVPTHCQPGIGWKLMVLLFMPTLVVFEFGILRLMGRGVPLPQIAPGEALLLVAVFFVGAIGEEVGWQGCAYPALRARTTALNAALVIGAVWALWHVIPFMHLGRSPEWLLWHSLNAIALRIIIVWLFENSRQNILGAVIFHTMINVSWALFPIAGSYYDPFVAFILLGFAAVTIVVVWGPQTLARFRTASPAASRPRARGSTPDV